MNRGQSHVVGVALMLGLTVAALGTLTMGIGSLMEAQAATADVQRVGDGLAQSLQPQRTTGHTSGAVRFTDGTLATVDRQISLSRNGTEVTRLDTNGLAFRADDRRVAFLGGAIVRGTASNTWFRREPPITRSADGDLLVVSVARLATGSVAVSGGGGRVDLTSTVTHDRRALGPGRYTVAIETAVPGPFAEYFRALNATVDRADRDGDGIPSVAATFPETTRAYLVIHEVSLEVADG